MTTMTGGHTQAGLERGTNRWRQFQKKAERATGKRLAGEILDLGCGRGEFVRCGLEAGIKMSGLDVVDSGVQTFRASVPEEWRSACQSYDGGIFPFADKRFSAIHSWFVFEHLPHPHQTICEMSRVAADGCVLVLDAQDGRTLFETHAKIPWMPYLPTPLQEVWLDELTTVERKDYIRSCVYPTTMHEVVAALKFFGWHLAKAEESAPVIPPPIRYPFDEEGARAAARDSRRLTRHDRWPSEPLNYRIIAFKGGPGVSPIAAKKPVHRRIGREIKRALRRMRGG